MSKLNINSIRNRDNFYENISSKSEGTLETYHCALNNFDNYCLEKFGKSDIASDLKENTDTEILDVLQDWINYNSHLSPLTVRNLFSRVKKYLHYMGVKLHPQDIKDEITFKKNIEEDLYSLTYDDIFRIGKEMKKEKHRVQIYCQSSSLMRIGEICQLKKKHLILGGENIIIKLPSTITKNSKARTTFFSKEASKMLYALLDNRGRKNKDVIQDESLIFGSSDKKKGSIINFEQILRLACKKVGLTKIYESTGRYQINTHSFRAFGITKFSRLDSNFAKKLAGQKVYLGQYDRITDEEKLNLYQKFESALTIDSLKRKDTEIKQLQDDKEKLIKAQIEIKTFKDNEMKAYFDKLMVENEIDKRGDKPIKELSDEYDPSWHDKK